MGRTTRAEEGANHFKADDGTPLYRYGVAGLSEQQSAKLVKNLQDRNVPEIQVTGMYGSSVCWFESTPYHDIWDIKSPYVDFEGNIVQQ
jgi:hypothetical protein